MSKKIISNEGDKLMRENSEFINKESKRIEKFTERKDKK